MPSHTFTSVYGPNGLIIIIMLLHVVIDFKPLGHTSAMIMGPKSEVVMAGVSNGTKVSMMNVWQPIGNKFFETLSFLPPLSSQDIAKQISYIVAKGWTPALEFSDPSCAYTMSHGNSGIVSSAACGYYDNRYWSMWKLPMFGCTDPNQVLNEIQKCTSAFPGCFVRIAGFDSDKQVQQASFIVHRPVGHEQIATTRRSV